jgi:hypothetical protein
MSGTYFNHLQTKGYKTMKHMLMAIMAVAVAVTFSAPAFAGDSPKEGGKDKKPGQVVETIYGDEKKKEEKKGGHADTFADADKKKEEKGK